MSDIHPRPCANCGVTIWAESSTRIHCVACAEKLRDMRYRIDAKREGKTGVALWFGKHKGKDLREVPSGYLRWLVEKFDVSPRPEQLRGMDDGFRKYLIERNRDMVAAAEEELSTRQTA